MTIPSGVDREKAVMRSEAKRLRAAVAARSGTSAAEAIVGHAMNLVTGLGPDTVVALYSPTQNEIDARFLATELDRAGFALALPVVTGRNEPLGFRRWGPGDPLSLGPYGIEEPEMSAPRVAPDIIFVPLLAYDGACHRLGYGGGYYDRTLAAYPGTRSFGLAFAAQVVDHIPREDHDIPLQAVVTESGVILPRKQRRMN